MSADEKFVFDNDDREFFDSHFKAIAEYMMRKRLWRNPWAAEVNGCVYKFTVTGYAKRGSEVWKEQESERQRAEG